MIIAIDFDGTIVEDAFPSIGPERETSIDVMKRLQARGHKIILWTCRDNILLEEAKNWLLERNFKPDSINSNICQYENLGANKVVADLYFDDRGFPPFQGWDQVEHLIRTNVL
jgi:uncharacterized HAD superfamily protein